MEALVLVNRGLEDVAQKEVKELLDLDSLVKPGLLIFKVKNLIDLAYFSYLSQSANRVLVLFSSGKFSEIDDKIINADLSHFTHDQISFASRCIKTTEVLSTKEMEGKTVEFIPLWAWLILNGRVFFRDANILSEA